MIKHHLVFAFLGVASAMPAQSPLTTTYAGGNGLGGNTAVYFDLTVNAPMLVTQLDVNALGGTGSSSIEFWTTPTTWVGNDSNPGAWTLLGSSAVVVAAPTGTPTVAPMTVPVPLAGGSHGVAIVYRGTLGPSYTNGTGANQTWSTNELTLQAGASGGIFNGAVNNPRVWNGSIHYTVTGSGTIATRTNYGSGCYDGIATFYEQFGTNTFDLSGSTAANSLLFVPAGGGYTAIPGSNAWFTPTSANLALGDDVVSPAQTLPFSFVTGTGAVTNQLWISSNGFVWPTANTNAGCCNGDHTLLRTQGERFAVMWQDLDPRTTGTIHFDVDPSGAQVYCTWLGVPEYANAGNLNTFQVMFDVSGMVEYRWQQCMNVTHTALVGWSPGVNARDPGNRDLSTIGTFTTVADSFGLALNASARPVVGTNFSLDSTSIPAGSVLGATIFSFTKHDPGLDLTSLGMAGCRQYVGLDVSFIFVVTGTTGSTAVSLPNDPGLAGNFFRTQSATFSSGFNLLGVLSSNGVELGIGNF
jgi:hypothetical protein